MVKPATDRKAGGVWKLRAVQWLSLEKVTNKVAMAEPAEKNTKLFLVLLTVIFSGIGSIVLMANDKQNLNKLLVAFGFEPIVSASGASDPSMEDANRKKPPSPIILMPERLLESPEANPPLTFRRIITRSPIDICSELQQRGLINAEWTAEDLGEQAWECSHELLVPALDDSEPPEGSLYISVRGLQHGQVSSVRLKINFLSGSISDRVLAKAVDAAAEILSAIGWGADPETLDHLKKLEAFEIKNNGNRMSLFREHTDVPRYNFLIVSETPAGEKRKAKNFGREMWLETPEGRE